MQPSDTISAVMLGCGKFSRYYHVPALMADAGVRLAAIFDPVPDAAVRELAEQASVPLVAAPDALPNVEGTTIAIVTTPHALHFDHVSFALSRDWHVLCDKPFVMRASEARALAAEAARRALVNAVAFNRRFDRGCLRARDMIRSGGIGAVRYIETVQLGYEGAGWFQVPELAGGGPFTGRATHMADIVPWLVGSKPTRLRARVRGGDATRVDRGGFIDLRFGDIECRMSCLEEGWHMWDEIRIFGDSGLIELRRPLGLPIGWEVTAHTSRGEAMERRAAAPNPGVATQNFLAAVRGGAQVGCSFADAVVSSAVVEEAFNSAGGDEGWRTLT
jgi:predicted dehydrogenase